MVHTEIRMAQRSDAEYMAPRLRKADLNEMMAVLGEDTDPVKALTYGIEISVYPFAGLIDHKVACIFGAVPEPLHTHVGSIWMMGTGAIAKHRVAFLRKSRPCLDQVFEPFSMLWNAVDKRNALHIRWLRWLGFRFLWEIPEYGEMCLPFLEFAKIKTDV